MDDDYDDDKDRWARIFAYGRDDAINGAEYENTYKNWDEVTSYENGWNSGCIEIGRLDLIKE